MCGFHGHSDTHSTNENTMKINPSPFSHFLKLLLAGSCAALIAACSNSIPFGLPEDLALMKQDLHLEHLPSGMVPLKWSYFDYGVQKEGMNTVVDSLALVQPGLLTLVGYEKGHYIRQAEFTSASTDCMYIFNGDVSAQPVWLLKADRPVFLTTGNNRGLIDVPLRKKLIDEMTAAGFRPHTDAQGKSYQKTGITERNLVMMTGYGQRVELTDQYQAYNVCKNKFGEAGDIP
ncbi:hypothetical protein SAMN03159382_02332 [Pseudomonas sp. NFACC23-1]|nr:hypothetical protein SAMN03159386_01992 [Pseudomonas sp. NFACC17-2]SEJ40364.1 hypothetical protein SAMN03159382_02332 [Pseudomonas sp. NFACC23-1]SFW65820.1 hypothetical protein SAMN05660640_02540 [Pseudomonas sp. NFACC16-2]